MSYSHLTLEDREVIQVMILKGFNFPEIGSRLGFHKSTIGREVERNSRPQGYIAHLAQKSAAERRWLSKPRPLMQCKKLFDYVVKKIKLTWSPEQISGRIVLEFPTNLTMRISHETIYQWIKEDKLLGGNLHMFLRQANKKRRKSYGKTSKRGQIPGRVFIEDRPQVVDRRNRFGDWEGDTVQSAGKKANIVTYVERKSRFLLSHVIGSKTPKEVNRATRIVFKGVPEKFCKTMTLDNGTEFAGFKDIEEALNIDVYFARPSQPNDRATNENTNGLIRQFLPKKKNFEFLKQRQLDKINRILNNRPRKCLNYRTPYEVLMRAVALQN